MKNSQRRLGPPQRNGVTLLELIVSLPTATILIGGMAMCITIMMRAKSQDDSLFRSIYDLSTAMNHVASDVESATALISSSARHIEFVVPDRDGDGLPEQMRYEWGGAAGVNANKILWKYNGGPLAVLFDDVGVFSLQRNTTSVPATVPNHLLTDTAVLKSSNAVANGVFREHLINANNPIGQYFIPDVPASGTRWDLGSIRIMVRSADSNTDGILCVRVMRSDTTKLPIAPLLAEVRIEEWRLGTEYQWLDIPIAPVAWQSQGTPLCVTLSYGGGTGDVARVQFMEGATAISTNANLVTSTDSGTTWAASTDAKSLRFYAFGFYDGYVGRRTFLSSVDLKLTSSRHTAQRMEMSVRVPAVPEIP